MRRTVLAFFVWHGLCAAQTATVNWGQSLQTIDGFGASVADSTGPLPDNLAQFFFSQSSGIGLSILRTQVMPDLADCQAWLTSAGGSASACMTVASGATSLIGEVEIAQQAAPYGLSFFASCWSPPASMKSNDLFYAGGNFIGTSANYTNFASSLASYVAFMSEEGVTISAISPQNEPDISESYPSALWTAQEFHDFVPYLYAALPNSVKVMIPEQSGWTFDLGSTAFSDSTVASEVGIINGHAYSGTPGATGLSNVTNQHIWMTEYSSQSGSYDGSIGDALNYATLVSNYLTQAGINAWIHWFISDMPAQGYGTDNAALTDINGNIPLRAYALGNWSKFVRPGWHMAGVTYSGGLLITSFQDAAGLNTAVVVVNNSGSPVTQTFSVGTAMGATTTPWITSSTFSLAAQTPVAISSGEFTYTLPASSVTTFSSSLPAPPTMIPASVIETSASGLAYSRVARTFNGTLTLTNVSSAPVMGPLQVAFSSLTSGVTLADATGSYSNHPYITVSVGSSLSPGQSVTINIQFSDPSNAIINFTPVIYSGSLN